MADESTRLKRVGIEELSFGVYELHLSEEEKQQFSDEPEVFLAKLLEEEGAPEPNELIVHRAGDPSIGDIFAEILTIRSGGNGGGTSTPPHPPHAVVLHQESGEHISRYFTLVVSG